MTANLTSFQLVPPAQTSAAVAVVSATTVVDRKQRRPRPRTTACAATVHSQTAGSTSLNPSAVATPSSQLSNTHTTTSLLLFSQYGQPLGQYGQPLSLTHRTRLEDPDDNVRVVTAKALIPTSTAIASLKVTLDVRSMRSVGLSYLNRYLIEREFVALKGRGSWKERDFTKVL